MSSPLLRQSAKKRSRLFFYVLRQRGLSLQCSDGMCWSVTGREFFCKKKSRIRNPRILWETVRGIRSTTVTLREYYLPCCKSYPPQISLKSGHIFRVRPTCSLACKNIDTDALKCVRYYEMIIQCLLRECNDTIRRYNILTVCWRVATVVCGTILSRRALGKAHTSITAEQINVVIQPKSIDGPAVDTQSSTPNDGLSCQTVQGQGARLKGKKNKTIWSHWHPPPWIGGAPFPKISSGESLVKKQPNDVDAIN